MEVEELEKQILSTLDIEVNSRVLAWSACDHEGRRKFVAVKTKGDKYVRMRAKRENAYHLRPSKGRTRGKGSSLAMMEGKQK